MTASTLLSLNFNDQSIVDTTGQWTADNNSPQIAFEQVGDNASYALVSRFTTSSNPVILTANDQSETVPYYTIDFDFYIPLGTPSNAQCSPILFRDATDYWLCLNASHTSGNYNMWLARHYGNYYSANFVESDYVITPGEWTRVRLSVLEEQDHSTTISLYINGVLVDSRNRDISYVSETTICKTAQLISKLGYNNTLGPNGFAIDNVIVTRGEAPLRPSVISLAGLQRNNANLLSYVHSKLAAVATSGSYNDLSDKPVIPPGVEFASEQEVTDTVLSEMDYLL